MMQFFAVSKYALGLASQIARESRKHNQRRWEIRQLLGATSDNNKGGGTV